MILLSKKKKQKYQIPPKHEIPKVPPEGYIRVQGNHGKSAVYTNGQHYISADIDQHIGGWWKVAKTIEALWQKKTRLGTYNKDLSVRMGD